MTDSRLRNLYHAPVSFEKEDIREEVLFQLRELEYRINEINRGEAHQVNWSDIVANRTIDADDMGRHLYVDTSGGDITLTLKPLGEKRHHFFVTQINDSTNQVILSGSGTTINGKSSTFLGGANHTLGLVWHETEGWLIEYTNKSSFAFDAASANYTFTAHAHVTEGTFESIGATGAGATNTWTALDNVPATATSIILGCRLYGDNAATGAKRMYARARERGSTQNGWCNTIAEIYAHCNSTYGELATYGEKTVNFVNQGFEFRWNIDDTPSGQSAYVFLVGYNI